jgi:hypothetical protein
MLFRVLRLAWRNFAMEPTESVLQILCNILLHGYHWWRELGLRSWHWDKATVLPMKESKPTDTKKRDRCIMEFVNKEFFLAGQTVSSDYHCSVLRRQLKNMRRLRPELWRQRNWQRTISHLILSRDSFYQMQHDCFPHPTHLTWPTTTIFFPSHRRNWADWGRIAGGAQYPQKHDFQDAFKNIRNAGNGAYSWNGTISRQMVASSY